MSQIQTAGLTLLTRHAWPACFTVSDSLLPGTTGATVQAGGKRRNYINTHHRGWEQAQARELKRAYAVAPERWLEGAAAAITSEFSTAWGVERERSASTQAMRMQIGKPCI
eukprot:3796186-Pleurochrysis_carterae.AAC.1